MRLGAFEESQPTRASLRAGPGPLLDAPCPARACAVLGAFREIFKKLHAKGELISFAPETPSLVPLGLLRPARGLETAVRRD